MLGRCHTLQTNNRSFTPSKSKFLRVNLNNSLDFKVFVHDDDYFYLSMNQKATGGFRFIIQKNSNVTKMIQIEIIKRVGRKTVQNNCNDEEGYNFTKCLKMSLETKVGCVPRWSDSERLNKIPECKTIRQMQNYEIETENLFRMGMKDVAEIYGCQKPCTYRELKFADELPIGKKDFGTGVFLVLADPEIRVETETQIYTLQSLVGEVGGSLGLFLGFSFFMIWDWTKLFYDFLKNKF